MQQYKKNLNEKEMKIQEMWDNMERSNSQIISITEGEESQDNGIVKIFKKFQKDFFWRHHQTKERHIYKIQETHRIPIKQDQKRKFPLHIIVKTLSI